MTNKDKRIKELEKENGNLFWVSMFIMLFLVILIIGLVISMDNEIINLEQQLQSCQEEVPLWILEVECYYPNINYYDIEIFGYNVAGNQDISLEFQSYKDYSSALEFAESDKYCEVIK